MYSFQQYKRKYEFFKDDNFCKPCKVKKCESKNFNEQSQIITAEGGIGKFQVGKTFDEEWNPLERIIYPELEDGTKLNPFFIEDAIQEGSMSEFGTYDVCRGQESKCSAYEVTYQEVSGPWREWKEQGNQSLFGENSIQGKLLQIFDEDLFGNTLRNGRCGIQKTVSDPYHIGYELTPAEDQ